MQGRVGTVVVLASSLLAALVAAFFLSSKRKLEDRLGHLRCQSEELPGVVTENEQGCKENKGGNEANEICVGVLGAIGRTPLIRISSLSDATGCEIFGKAEFLNPGGSVKDRVAAKIIDEALQSGALQVGGVVTEGSAGSTAVSLAMVAVAHGCKCHVVLPDDAAIEKTQILEAMGATVERVRPVSITHKDHFVNVARRRALEAQAAFGVLSSPQPEISNFLENGAIKRHDNKEDQHLQEHLPVVQKDSNTIIQHSGGLVIDDCAAIGSARQDSASCLEKETVTETEIHSAPQSTDQPQSISQCGCDLRKECSSEGNKVSYVEREVRGSGAGAVCCSVGRGGFFADQFENLANFRAHYEGTAPEIWRQTGGKIDAFVAAAGTGGTIAGISCYLKEQYQMVKCFLIDPPGSGLYNRVTRGVMFSKEEAEGKRMTNPFDTITEGIGINRITGNFKRAQLDGAFRGTDREAVEMARYLLKNDGLFVGSSSAMNCVGAVRVAHLLGPGHTIVTILCDGGARHLSKFQSPEYLAVQGLTPRATGLEFLTVSTSTFSPGKI